MLPNICIAYDFFFMLPVSVAEAEQSFSKLELVKNHLRSSMSQERFQGLALLSIESDFDLKISVASNCNVNNRLF